jgi:hypothetical protein
MHMFDAKTVWMVAGWTLAALVGCSTTTEPRPTPSVTPTATATTTAGAVPDEGNACVFPAAPGTPPTTECPANCVAMPAVEIDEAMRCVRRVLLGCHPCTNGCGGAPEPLICQRNEKSGRIVRAPYPLQQDTPGWIACTEDEDKPFATLARCD